MFSRSDWQKIIRQHTTWKKTRKKRQSVRFLEGYKLPSLDEFKHDRDAKENPGPNQDKAGS